MNNSTSTTRRFSPGEDCWDLSCAEQLAFLVDGKAYFETLAEAFESARRTIYIVGWDIDSRIVLRREDKGDRSETLGELLNRLAREHEDLHVYLLEWDFAVLYSLERENLLQLKFEWQGHARVHFKYDDYHPVGASHHQKIVVIDDRLAFVGGFDLARARWDTPEHRPEEPLRQDNGSPHGPFHDIQAMVSGPVARSLGDLVRRRWEWATGEQLEAIDDGQADWPEAVEPEGRDLEIAILRTEPDYDGHPAVQEIKDFHLAAIRNARRWLYIENQYFTSHAVGEALESSLHEEEGPEILLVLPRVCSGWLEQNTMGSLRRRLVEKLRAADRFGRLRILYPHRADFGEETINVHSKVLIADGELLTIGSANLNNRSMGFDTECNLALSTTEDSSREVVKGLLGRLLGEHLDLDGDSLQQMLEENDSLLAILDRHGDRQRCLKELPVADEKSFTAIMPHRAIFDPETPIEATKLLDYLGLDPSGTRPSATSLKPWLFGATLLLALLLAAAWRWTPLNTWIDLQLLLEKAEALRASSFAPVVVLMIYLVGSCVMFPITLLIVATALSFGPVSGFLLALAGSLLGGAASYLLGHIIGRDTVRRLAGDKLNRVSRKLARKGWLAIAVLRVVPVAPFTVVNLVAGSSAITLKSFMLGTAVGMAPGILAIMIFQGGIEQVVLQPGWGSVAIGGAAVLLAVGVLYFGKRWLLRQDDDDG